MNTTQIFTTDQRERYTEFKDELPGLLQSCFQAGKILQEIRDEELYKIDGFDSFEGFCKPMRGLSYQYAYRLIEAAEVKESVKNSPMGENLQNERQARELGKVDPKERVEVLERAHDAGSITAHSIEEAADAWQPGLAQTSMLEKIDRIWMRFQSLEGRPEKVLVEGVNLLRESGLHLQGLAGHERMAKGRFLKLRDRLPPTMDFDKAKNCIRLAHKFKTAKATLQDCGGEESTVMLVRGAVKTRHREGRQQSHEETPFVTVVGIFSDIRIPMDKLFQGRADWDKGMRKSIGDEFARQIKWLGEMKGKL